MRGYWKKNSSIKKEERDKDMVILKLYPILCKYRMRKS
jgi:hypothetical protein